MANTFLADPTLPDVGELVTGLELKASPMADLYALHNHNIAYSGAHVLWAQAWPEGMVIEDVAVGTGLTFPVRVPYSPYRKGRYQVSLDMEMTGAGPVTVRCAGLGFNADVTVTIAGRRWYSKTFTIGLPGAVPYEEPRLVRQAGDGVLYGVVFELLPDLSPLAGGRDAGEPIGDAQAGAEYPLTASIGVAMIETLAALRLLPRVLSAWAGTYGTGKYQSYADPGVHGGWGYRHIGAGSATYTIWANVYNANPTAKMLRVGQVEIPLAAGYLGWVSATVVVSDSQSAQAVPLTPGAEGLEELLGCGWSVQDASGVAVQDDTIIESDPDVYVYSLTVWGP